jgi:hypothetical protein
MSKINEMALLRPKLGHWLFDHFQDREARAIENASNNEKEFKLNGLSLEEARRLILTAEARANLQQPEELRMWFTYSRYYLYLIWYKGYKVWKKVNAWLDRPFLS